MCDDLREYVAKYLGGPDAVLVVDETGDLKKDRCTVGVQRRYTGTAGRIESAQVGAYLTHTRRGGHALIDRELCPPKSWTADLNRCAGAGVPEDVQFATKPVRPCAGAPGANVPGAGHSHPSRRATRPRTGGYWYDPTDVTVSWRTTAAMRPRRFRCASWVRVAGRRWTIEESFRASKGLAGLDEDQVRRWTSWRRWTSLSMFAHALLAVIADTEQITRPAPVGVIALTCNEISRLFTGFVIEAARVLACPQAWSLWRRGHQHRARIRHYQHRMAANP